MHDNSATVRAQTVLCYGLIEAKKCSATTKCALLLELFSRKRVDENGSSLVEYAESYERLPYKFMMSYGPRNSIALIACELKMMFFPLDTRIRL